MDYTQSPQISAQNVDQNQFPPKKSGCGCFLIGCFMILFMVAAPFIGGGIYIASLSDEDWGEGIIWVAKNNTFSNGFKNGIRENAELQEAEKEAMIQLYDSFLSNYEKLPAGKQTHVKKDLVELFKKLFKDQNNPTIQTEVTEIYRTLESVNGPQYNRITTPTPEPTPIVIPQTPDPQSAPDNSTNKYDF